MSEYRCVTGEIVEAIQFSQKEEVCNFVHPSVVQVVMDYFLTDIEDNKMQVMPSDYLVIKKNGIMFPCSSALFDFLFSEVRKKKFVTGGSL